MLLGEASENNGGEYKQIMAPNTPILDWQPGVDGNKDPLTKLKTIKSTPKKTREERERKRSRSGLRFFDKPSMWTKKMKLIN